MRLPGEGRLQRRGGHTQPPGRLTRGQEIALFVVLLLVLLALIAYGLHA